MNILRKLMNRILGWWQRRATRRKVITVLACAVVFTTVYALIMPAITLTTKTASAMNGISIDEAYVGEIAAETEPNADYGVVIKLDEKALVPTGTTAEVQEILPESEESDYTQWYEKALEAVTADCGTGYDIRQIHLYTVNLLYDGEVIQPEAPVEISFNYEKGFNLFDRSLLTAITLPVNEEGKPEDEQGKLIAPEEIMPDSEDEGADVESVTFKTANVSVVAVAELEDISAGTLSADGEDFTITVQYSKEAQIPTGSILDVSEIMQGTEEYQEYYAKTAETVSSGSLDYARFFDVTISYDGEELEPAAPVSVQISYDTPLDISEEQQVQAIHFAENNGMETPELLDISNKTSETEGDTEKVTDIAFQQESFSVVGTVVTTPATTGYWPTGSGEYAIVVTADHVNYYAVNNVGNLVQVSVTEDASGNPTTVTFPDTIANAGQLAPYMWMMTIENAQNSGQRRVTNTYDGRYLSPVSNSGIAGEIEEGEEVYLNLTRDSYGHVYYYGSYNDSMPYHYLGIDTTNMEVLGSEDGSMSTSEISTDACAVYFVNDFTVDSEEDSTWPFSSDDQYLVVTADNTNYYAVKRDGTLVPVTISGDQIVFDGAATGVTESDLPNFRWDLSSGSTSEERQIKSSVGSAYIDSTSSTGLGSTAVSLLRDSSGHIYILDADGTTYHYLGMDATGKTLSGDGTGSAQTTEISESACGTKFYSSASVTNDSGTSGGGTTLGELEADKTLTPHNATTENPDGDGSYDLTLSVTGQEEKTDSSSKIDVVFVFDNSHSMYSNYVGSYQRIYYAKQALKTAASSLLSNNTTYPDAIHLSLVTFSTRSTIQTFDSSYFTDDYSDFEDVVDGLEDPTGGANGATNWEDALDDAATVVQDTTNGGRSDAKKYVIFISDGNPTIRNTAGGYTGPYYSDSPYNNSYTSLDNGGTAVYFTGSGIDFDNNKVVGNEDLYGTGMDDNSYRYSVSNVPDYGDVNVTIHYTTNVQRCYEQAVDEAQALGTILKNKNGDFFAISAYGSITNMNSILQEAYGDTEVPANHYFEAGDQTELDAAFSKIIEEIIGDYMYSGVTVKDGVTNLTMFYEKDTTGLADLSGKGYEFTYYRYGGYNETTGQNDKYGTADNPTEWTPAEWQKATYDSTNKQIVWNLTKGQEDPTDTTNFKDLDDLTWDDLGSTDYKLEDGVTYVLKVRVWPDQAAYDALMSIKNAGLSPNEGETAEEAEQRVYDSLSEDVKSQIVKGTDGNYYLETNTEASADYTVMGRTLTRPEDNTGVTKISTGETELPDPPDMSLTYAEMNVYKEWSGDTSSARPASVTLDIYQAETKAYADAKDKTKSVKIGSVVLPNPADGSNRWEDTIYISPGISQTYGSGDTAETLILEPGHYYWVDEPSVQSGYTFTGETVHPYLKDDANEITLEGDGDNALTAVNSMSTAGILIKKTDDSTTPNYLNGAHFKLLRKNSDGTYVSIPVVVSDGTTTTTTYPYDDFTITDGSAGYLISNLSAGDYKLEEISAPDGYIFKDKDTYITISASDPYITINTDEDTDTTNAQVTGTTMEGLTGTANNTLVIKNYAGQALPNTGGFGTPMLMIAGGILILLAAGGLVWSNRKKRKSGDNPS
jgi:LPXTG-motif cell wall-anchored protein